MKKLLALLFLPMLALAQGYQPTAGVGISISGSAVAGQVGVFNSPTTQTGYGNLTFDNTNGLSIGATSLILTSATPFISATGAGPLVIQGPTAQNITLDETAAGTSTITIGGTNATTLTLGRSGQTTNVNGNAAFGTSWSAPVGTLSGSSGLVLSNATPLINATGAGTLTVQSAASQSISLSPGGTQQLLLTTTPTLELSSESTLATARRLFIIHSGGFAEPATNGGNSNGDKLSLLNNATLNYSGKIGVGAVGDLWFSSGAMDGTTNTASAYRWFDSVGPLEIFEAGDPSGVPQLKIAIDSQGSATAKKQIIFGAGGFSEPTNGFSTVNGTKLSLYDNATDNFSFEIGVGNASDAWFKTWGGALGTGQFRFFDGSTELVRLQSISAVATVGVPGAGTISLDSLGAGTAQVGAVSATTTTIGRSGQTTNINGTVAFGTVGPSLGGTTTGSWNANTGGLVVTATTNYGGFSATASVNNVKFRNVTCNHAVAGSGANGTLAVRNVTDSTTLCSGAYVCTTTANTPTIIFDCNATPLAAKAYAVQFSTGCGTTQVTGLTCDIEIAH